MVFNILVIHCEVFSTERLVELFMENIASSKIKLALTEVFFNSFVKGRRNPDFFCSFLYRPFSTPQI
jgi:hypothetical protein